MNAVKKLLCLFALVLCLPANAYASAYQNYLGLDASIVTVENSIGQSLEPENFRLRLGTSLSAFIDLEGHLGITVNSDEKLLASWSTDFVALFMKGYLPVGRFTALYSMGGFSGVSLVETVGRQDFTEERYGFAYGAGIEVVLAPTIDLSFDYVNYLRDEGLLSSVSAVSLGLKFYF